MRLPQRQLIDTIKQQILTDLHNEGFTYTGFTANGRRIVPPWPHGYLEQGTINAIKDQVLREIEAEWAANSPNNRSPGPTDRQGSMYQQGAANRPSMYYRQGAAYQPGANPQSNWQQTVNNWLNRGQFKGLLAGLGTAALAGMLVPSVGKKLLGVIFRTVEEGRDLADRARSTAARAKESLEDIFAEASFNRLRTSFMEEDDHFSDNAESKPFPDSKKEDSLSDSPILH